MTLNPPNSGSPVQVASVTLSSAQLLAIFTTPATLIPAPGPGSLTWPLHTLWVYDFGGVAYTDNGGALVIGHRGHLGPNAWVAATTAGWWNQASSSLMSVSPGNPGPAPITDFVNLDLVAQQNTANPTLGNGTVTLTIAYITIAVS